MPEPRADISTRYLNNEWYFKYRRTDDSISPKSLSFEEEEYVKKDVQPVLIASKVGSGIMLASRTQRDKINSEAQLLILDPVLKLSSFRAKSEPAIPLVVYGDFGVKRRLSSLSDIGQGLQRARSITNAPFKRADSFGEMWKTEVDIRPHTAPSSHSRKNSLILELAKQAEIYPEEELV